MEKWINMSRALQEWQWRDEPSTVLLWFYLLLRAEHETEKHRGVTAKRGQVATCRRRLAGETGLSERRVRTALRRLAEEGRITVRGTSQCTLVTIRDYDLYCRMGETPMFIRTSTKGQ